MITSVLLQWGFVIKNTYCFAVDYINYTCVDLLLHTNLSKVSNAYIFRDFVLWRWKQYVRPKRSYLLPKKINIDMFLIICFFNLSRNFSFYIVFIYCSRQVIGMPHFMKRFDRPLLTVQFCDAVVSVQRCTSFVLISRCKRHSCSFHHIVVCGVFILPAVSVYSVVILVKPLEIV